VKKFWKSVSIWCSYGQQSSVVVFLTHSVYEWQTGHHTQIKITPFFTTFAAHLSMQLNALLHKRFSQQTLHFRQFMGRRTRFNQLPKRLRRLIRWAYSIIIIIISHQPSWWLRLIHSWNGMVMAPFLNAIIDSWMQKCTKSCSKSLHLKIWNVHNCNTQ